MQPQLTRALWLELVLVTLIAATLVACVPLSAGEWSWSWDALNHHVYLGLIAEQPRWHLDVVAASVQSYQYPYLYWPVYRLGLLDVPAAFAAAVWGAGLAALLTVPAWMLSWRLLRTSEGRWQAIFERTAACALALSSIVVLGSLTTTANDPLAAVPVLWAMVVMALPAPSDRRAGAAAMLLGVGIAFKLSNGVFLPLLLIWWWAPGTAGWWWRRGLWISAGATAGFVLTYLPWGWQLWRHTGNPFYPLLRSVFGG